MFLLISWRWVMKVVAVIASTRKPAKIITAALPLELVKELCRGTWLKIEDRPKDLARSVVRKPCPSSFLAALLRIRNRARKIGICTSSGRQDANGLVPASL